MGEPMAPRPCFHAPRPNQLLLSHSIPVGRGSRSLPSLPSLPSLLTVPDSQSTRASCWPGPTLPQCHRPSRAQLWHRRCAQGAPIARYPLPRVLGSCCANHRSHSQSRLTSLAGWLSRERLVLKQRSSPHADDNSFHHPLAKYPLNDSSVL
jgi:hypothetical protein